MRERPRTPIHSLDREERVEQRAGRKHGRANGCRVQERRLIAGHAFGRGLDDGGDAKIVNRGGEPGDREVEVAGAIAEVRAESDGDRRAGHARRGYSIQRVGATAPVRWLMGRWVPMRSSRPWAACSKIRLCSSISPSTTFSMPLWRA